VPVQALAPMAPIHESDEEVAVSRSYYRKSPAELARDIAVSATALQETQPRMTFLGLLRRIREARRRE